MGVVRLQVPVTGSNSSTPDMGLPWKSTPPATSTCPVLRSVAVWLTCLSSVFPAPLQELIAGSYSCELGAPKPALWTTSTFPDGKSVAVCPVPMVYAVGPVELQVPDA